MVRSGAFVEAMTDVSPLVHMWLVVAQDWQSDAVLCIYFAV